MTRTPETTGQGLAPPGALCTLHAARTATRICARCGGFMCQACSEDGYERRCPKCRPPVPPSVRQERLQNALEKSGVVTCLQCGYAGRKLDRFRGFKPVDFLVVPGLFALGFGILIIFFLIRMKTSMCPACRSTQRLKPEMEDPSPGSDEVWRAADALEQRRIRRHTLAFLGALALVGTSLVVWVRR